jgi:hypothetical protein
MICDKWSNEAFKNILSNNFSQKQPIKNTLCFENITAMFKKPIKTLHPGGDVNPGSSVLEWSNKAF